MGCDCISSWSLLIFLLCQSKSNFIWSLHGMGERKFVQTVQVTWPIWPPRLYMVKILKNLQNQKGRWPLKLVCSIKCSNTTKFVQMMTLSWPWPTLQQGQIWSLMLLYGKKVKQWIFQKLLKSMIWNKQQMTEVTRSYCWHQNLSPGGYIYVLNHEKWKKLYKIRLQRDFFETCYKKVKW